MEERSTLYSIPPSLATPLDQHGGRDISYQHNKLDSLELNMYLELIHPLHKYVSSQAL